MAPLMVVFYFYVYGGYFDWVWGRLPLRRLRGSGGGAPAGFRRE